MKIAFNIAGIVMTIIFAIIIFYYADEVDSARSYSYSSYSSYSGYSSDPYSSSYSYSTPSYSSYSDSYSELTEEAGLWSLLFFLYFTFLFIFNLIKVKTKTTKVLSIIGISLTGLWLCWDLLMIADGGALSFDEIAPGFIFYCLVVLAFTIIGTIHVGIANKKTLNIAPQSKDVLDNM